jgi:hypothetical protein
LSQTASDESIIGSSLQGLSLWPNALSDMISLIVLFRELFPSKFPIGIVFETCMTVNSLLCIEIVLHTEICEKTAEYCMKALSLVLMQRFQKRVNFDYSIALHGILILLGRLNWIIPFG